MINPLPKNGLFATLNANEVAGIIAGLPEEYRASAYRIYFGTMNHCSTVIDDTLKAYGYHTVAMEETQTVDLDCDVYPGDPV